MHLFYAVGIGDDKCKIMWSCYAFPEVNPCTSLSAYRYYSKASTGTMTQAWASIFWNRSEMQEEIVSTDLLPGFHIKSGEKKIILEICFYRTNGSKISPREVFGLLVLNPKYYAYHNAVEQSFLATFVIFTPKPGLFSETPPQ
jgi:hypothetical protein